MIITTGRNDFSTEQPLSAEEQLVGDLVKLAITIRDAGQVNPLTVVDVLEGVTRQLRIETGKRHYWATWLLHDLIPGYESDGMIPCIGIRLPASEREHSAIGIVGNNQRQTHAGTAN